MPHESIPCAPVYVPTSDEVTVQGRFHYFGTYAEVYDASGTLHEVINDSKPHWHTRDPGDSDLRVVRFGNGSLFAGQRVIAGATALDRLVRPSVASNRAMTIWPLDLGCVVTVDPRTTTVVLPRSVQGPPACALAVYRKGTTVQLTSGYNLIHTMVAPGPVYVELSVVPSSGDGTGFTATPIYFAYRPVSMPVGAFGTGYKLGDIMPMNNGQTPPLVFNIGDDVATLGLWLPEAELPVSTPAPANPYSVVDVTVYSMPEFRRAGTPLFTGSYTPNFLSATIPGYFAGEQGVRSGT